MVNTATGARPGEGGCTGDGPQVTWERGGAEERQSQVHMPKDLENDLVWGDFESKWNFNLLLLLLNRTNSVHHNPGSKDAPPCLSAPPPLISPKGPHHPPAPPTTLWNPASLVDTPADSRRKLNPPTPPSRPPPGLTRAERPPLSWGEKLEEGGRRRAEGTERYTSLRAASLQEAGSWNKAEQDRAIQSLYHRHHISNLHQKSCAPPSIPGACADLLGRCQAASLSPVRERQSQPPDSMLVYDEVLQQHRRLLSKLDLEEKRRTEAREGGEQDEVAGGGIHEQEGMW